jgi:hypothetical protein
MASRLAGLLAVLLLAYPLTAQQFHGVGASLTTSSPQKGMNDSGVRSNFGARSGFDAHGTPPSLTSITPGEKRFISPGDVGRRRHGHHGHGENNFVPIFVPTYSYPYYPYGYSDLYPESDVSNGMEEPQPEDPRPPALTVFENRPGYRPPAAVPADSRDYASAEPSDASSGREATRREAQPVREPAPVADQAPTVLVFRDGRHLEIGNYAIQGDLLYNLDGKGPRKIKLADLDLAKTVQANDERGNEFRLPKNFRG